MWWMTPLTWAGPPALPEWDLDDREAVAIGADIAASHRPADKGRAPTVALVDDTPTDHAWASVDGLELAIAGDWERRYYVVCTARAGGEVWHWRQGPYDTPDQTLIVDVLAPDDVTSAVDRVGLGHLTTYVVATDFGGHEVDRTPLPRLGLGPHQGATRGLDMNTYEQLLGVTDAEEGAW